MAGTTVPKIERQMQLVAELLNTAQPLSADELRRRVDGYPDSLAAFRRMFERDKVDLRDMGVPIAVEAVLDANPPIDGYRIRPDDYNLKDPGLAPDELAAVALAARMVRFDSNLVDEALWKLGAPTYDDGGPVETVASLQLDPAVSTLFGAISTASVTQFGYSGETRTVEPLRLQSRRGRWYLDAWDRDRDALRRFRIDRFDSAPLITDQTFTSVGRDLDRDERQPWQFDEEPARTAEVLIDPAQAAWATAQVGVDKISEHRADGSIVVTVEVTNVANFRSFVLGFGRHAEILSPEELRADLVSWLQALVAGGPS